MTTTPFASDPTAVRGAITPLVTPFADDGSLDLDAIKPLVDWQLERGTHGISVGGSTGEPTSLTVAERIAVMRATAQAVDGRVPFLPGTGSALMQETLELTAEAQSLGAAAASSSRPTTGARSRRDYSAGTHGWPRSSRICRSSSTTCPCAPRSMSRPRQRGAYAVRTRTSSASRRPPATSNTSLTCCTRPAGTSSPYRVSSC